MQSENEWSKNRLCAVCGGSFTLRVHGTAEARSAAQFLQQGILNAAELPPLISRCPNCLDTGKISEREAVAAVREMGLALDSDDSQHTLRYVRQGGVLAGLLGVTGLLLTFGFGSLKKAVPDYLLYFALFGLLTLAGFGAAAWAFARLRELESGRRKGRK